MTLITNYHDLELALNAIVQNLARTYHGMTAKDKLDTLQCREKAYIEALGQFSDKAKWATGAMATSLAVPATILWYWAKDSTAVPPETRRLLLIAVLISCGLILEGCVASLSMLKNYYNLYSTSAIDCWLHYLGADIEPASWSLHAQQAMDSLRPVKEDVGAPRLESTIPPPANNQKTMLRPFCFPIQKRDVIYTLDPRGLTRDAVSILAEAWRLSATNTFQQYRQSLRFIHRLALMCFLVGWYILALDGFETWSTLVMP